MTDTTFRLIAAGRGMRSCSICGRQARPGARLCTACKSALKRARQETVSELVPLPHRSRTRDEALRRDSVSKDEPAPAASASRVWPHVRRRDAVIVGLCGAVLALVVYVEAPGWRTTPAIAVTESTAATVAAAPARRADVAPAVALPGGADTSPPRHEPPPLEAPQRAGPSVAKDAPSKALPAGDRVRSDPPKAPPAIAAEDDRANASAFGPIAELPTPAPVPAPAPAPVARAAPPPDRWQLLQEAIARCGREGFLGAIVCEQKLRLAACEGYWGQVPQCPSGIANDHGQ